MAAQPDVAARIRTELAAYLKRDVETIKPEASLREDLGLDSMATIELLYRIEEAFDLQIPDEDLPALVRVGDVVSYVERRVAPPASPTSPPRPKKKRG